MTAILPKPWLASDQRKVSAIRVSPIVVVGSHGTHAIRPLHWPVLIGFRLHDVFHDAVHVQLLGHLDPGWLLHRKWI
jgi:hypothetical protein